MQPGVYSVHRRTSGLPGAVYEVKTKTQFCLLNNGLLPFRVRTVQSVVGQIVTMFMDSNMLETPKQQIE